MSSSRCTHDTGRYRRAAHLLATTAMLGLWATATTGMREAAAQTAPAGVNAPRNFDIPARPLATALAAFGRQSGLQVTLAAATTRGITARAVSGTLRPETALAQMLDGTGISFRITPDGTAVISAADTGPSPSPAPSPAADGSTLLGLIDIYGSSMGRGSISETVIDTGELERKNPATIADVFRGDPAFQVGSSLPMSQKVYVHGVEENNLAVSIDDSRQNNKVFHHNGTNLIDPELLGSVRIDAGVAPADAGPGALAGAIIYETKDARDLLPGEGMGGQIRTAWNSNGNVFTTGLGIYGVSSGLEFLGYANLGRGGAFRAGDGSTVPGTETDILSGLGKVAFEAEGGSRVEISHEQVRDDALRPFRANMTSTTGARPWEPLLRRYDLRRRNTVLTWTETAPEGWWDPKAVIALSATSIRTPIYLRTETYNDTAETRSINGRFENRFALDTGSITAGIDFYNDRAVLDDKYEPARERMANTGLYAQARLEPWERARLSFGGRADRQTFTGTTGRSWNSHGTSANISGEYDVITDVLTARAGYSHVWAGIPLAENFIMNPKWDYGAGPEPVSADNYIFGLRATHEGFTLEGSVFGTDIDDIRSARFAVTRAIENHDMRSRGFEIGAGYDWGDGHVRARYASIDVTVNGRPVDSDTGTYIATPVGDALVFSAAHTFTGHGLTIGGDISFVFDYDRVAPGNSPLGGYELANIFAEYRPPERENLTFRAEVKNVFGETYADRATYGQEFGIVKPLHEPGRTFILSARTTF